MQSTSVDPQIENKVNEKIAEIAGKTDEIMRLRDTLADLRSRPDPFAYGIAVGRLYNSFYYQCRRILKRSPTEEEFAEFLVLLGRKQTEILDALKPR